MVLQNIYMPTGTRPRRIVLLRQLLLLSRRKALKPHALSRRTELRVLWCALCLVTTGFRPSADTAFCYTVFTLLFFSVACCFLVPRAAYTIIVRPLLVSVGHILYLLLFFRSSDDLLLRSFSPT